MQVWRCWGFNVIFCANLIIEEIWTSSNATYSSPILKAPKSKYILTPFCISQSRSSMAFLWRFFTTKKSWGVDLFPTWICKRQKPSTCNGDPLAVRSLMSFFYSSSLGRNFLKTLLLMPDTSAPVSTKALYLLRSILIETEFGMSVLPTMCVGTFLFRSLGVLRTDLCRFPGLVYKISLCGLLRHNSNT